MDDLHTLETRQRACSMFIENFGGHLLKALDGFGFECSPYLVEPCYAMTEVHLENLSLNGIQLC